MSEKEYVNAMSVAVVQRLVREFCALDADDDGKVRPRKPDIPCRMHGIPGRSKVYLVRCPVYPAGSTVHLAGSTLYLAGCTLYLVGCTVYLAERTVYLAGCPRISTPQAD